MSCPDCTAGEVLPREPTGRLSTQGAYFTFGPGDEPRSSKRAIVLLTNIFGLPLKNCKIIADHLAKELGCDVWVPDLFAGWPIMALSQLKAARRMGVQMTTSQSIPFYLGMLPKIPALISSRPAVVDARISNFIEAILKEKKYEKIGAVGYCFGGTLAVRLDATDLVQSIVVCHPGPFSVPQVKAIKTPAAWVFLKIRMRVLPIFYISDLARQHIDDQFFPSSTRLKMETIFAERKRTTNSVDYEFKDYKGTVHGFALRPDLNNAEVKEAYERSLEQTVA